MESYNFPSPDMLRKALTTQITAPIVFKHQLKQWKQFPNTIEDFVKKFGDTLLDFRIVPHTLKDIAWEGSAQYVKATIRDFVEWQSHDEKQASNSPFYKFIKEDYWAYSSYNYMNDVFPENSELLQNINWSSFGFPDESGKDCTFWLGSKGSNTPCHVDSYGFNLVAQIEGRKKWILFPPEDGAFMYPTRIPYEESSIFSLVNMLEPNFTLHPKFKKTHPYTVTLERGDILFVPKGWWHFVCSLDPVNISINTWIKMESDDHSRLTESISRALMTALIPIYEPPGKHWLNSKEELVPADETLGYIASLLQVLKRKEKIIIPNQDSIHKIQKTSKDSNVHTDQLNNTYKFENVIAVTQTTINNLFPAVKENKIDSQEIIDIDIEKIINCFIHPEVVKVISHLLLTEI